ncbi:HEAT repeat domain-containing protein [Streptomyces sp. NPDC048636]|uniref:HEAT repeat domain-containing protein n=1 Tax=Streptomyces sp. NPDC048636 TaxID=3155762 RepID=UPI0034469E07
MPSRRAVLDLMSMLAYEAGQVAERSLDPGWVPSWSRVLPDVLALLADPSAEIRRAAVEVVGVCHSAGELVLPALLRCWETEEDPKTRLDLVLALGRATGREPAGPEAARVHDLLRGLLHGPEPQLRLAAVHALAPGDPDLPVRELHLVLAAIRDPGVAEWQGTSMVDNGGARGAQAMTALLFTGPSPDFVLGLLADHPDEEQRIGALAQAGGLAAEWRPPHPPPPPPRCCPPWRRGWTTRPPRRGIWRRNCWRASGRRPPPMRTRWPGCWTTPGSLRHTGRARSATRRSGPWRG